jgi:hypothetical protein
MKGWVETQLYKEDSFELMNEGENGLQIFLIIST